jgi:putative oxidoreductase
MKIAKIIVRTLTGLLFIFSSVAWFFNLVQQPELSGPIKQFSEGMAASGYFIPLLKTVELLCGIALLIGRFVPLAMVILAPVVVNIFFVHLLLDRSGLPVAIFLVAAFLFLAYCYRDRFAPLLKP